MKLVLLFFCAILVFIVLCILLIITSSIKLNIKKINMSNFEDGVKKGKLQKEFIAYIEMYLFGKIKIARIKIDKKLIEKLKLKNKIGDVQKDIEEAKKIKLMVLLKKLKIRVENLSIDAQIGTEDVNITVFLVTLISAIFGILSRNIEHENVDFYIMPLYQFGNVINFKLNCIINVKMVHIINIIYILFKKGRMKNERTSNRGAYDYSYE